MIEWKSLFQYLCSYNMYPNNVNNVRRYLEAVSRMGNGQFHEHGWTFNVLGLISIVFILNCLFDKGI